MERPDGSAIAGSGAYVTIYDASQVYPTTIYVRPSGKGNWWKVLTFQGEKEKLIKVNTISTKTVAPYK